MPEIPQRLTVSKLLIDELMRADAEDEVMALQQLEDIRQRCMEEMRGRGASREEMLEAEALLESLASQVSKDLQSGRQPPPVAAMQELRPSMAAPHPFASTQADPTLLYAGEGGIPTDPSELLARCTGTKGAWRVTYQFARGAVMAREYQCGWEKATLIQAEEDGVNTLAVAPQLHAGFRGTMKTLSKPLLTPRRPVSVFVHPITMDVLLLIDPSEGGIDALMTQLKPHSPARLGYSIYPPRSALWLQASMSPSPGRHVVPDPDWRSWCHQY